MLVHALAEVLVSVISELVQPLYQLAVTVPSVGTELPVVVSVAPTLAIARL